MMKKLLILVLVLGISSASYGQSAWYEADGTSGTLEVVGGQVVIITLVADIAVGGIQIQIINDNGAAGTAQGVVAPAYGVHANLNTGALAGAGANMNARLFAVSLVSPLNSFQGSQGMNPAAGAGQALLWFEYIVPQGLEESTNIVIDSYNVNPAYPASAKEFVNGDGGTPSIIDMGSVTLHIIPEPVTIALLGLGGLFLVRRRK